MAQTTPKTGSILSCTHGEIIVRWADELIACFRAVKRKLRMENIFLISPKRDHRERLMPRLAALVGELDGVKILGLGSTGVKVEVDDPGSFRMRLSSDVLECCFVKPVARYTLA
jgi:hypothetical protein